MDEREGNEHPLPLPARKLIDERPSLRRQSHRFQHRHGVLGLWVKRSECGQDLDHLQPGNHLSLLQLRADPGHELLPVAPGIQA